MIKVWQKKADGREIVASNRKASHEYFLEEKYEAGLVLTGSEIKSIRAHRVNLGEGWVEEQSGELWLMDVHINEYKEASRFGHKPTRPRKLLLHRKEINRIIGRIQERGFTIVPTVMYLVKGRAKVEIAIAKGKKQYDKRAATEERETNRNIRRAIKSGEWE